MKLNRKLIRKMILKEMSGMIGVRPQGSLTFEKISDIHRFVGFASENGRHWMFPQGIPHEIFVELNSLFVQRIARMDSNDPAALQEYATMVMQVPGADLGSIEEIFNA